MKTYVETLGVFFGIFLFFIGGLFIVRQCSIEETENTAYEIIEVIPTVSGRYHKEYTVIIINTDDGKYTLPDIPTNLVRRYHEGDMIPVIVNTFKDGTKEILINRKELQ